MLRNPQRTQPVLCNPQCTALPAEASQEEREAEREAAAALQAEIQEARETVRTAVFGFVQLWRSCGVAGRRCTTFLPTSLNAGSFLGPCPASMMQIACRIALLANTWGATGHCPAKPHPHCTRATVLPADLFHVCALQIAAAEERLAEIRERIKSATAEAGALKQAEAAVRKEQAEVIKQAERAEKQVGALCLRHQQGPRLRSAPAAVAVPACLLHARGCACYYVMTACSASWRVALLTHCLQCCPPLTRPAAGRPGG